MDVDYLFDTSELKRWSNDHVRAVGETFAAPGRLGRASICDLEVGFLTRNQCERDQPIGALAVLVTSCRFNRARQVQGQQASRSQKGRKIPDFLFVATAELFSVGVLPCNTDRELLADLKGQSCTWIEPAGTVK